jgi:hypothetical protein
MFRQDCYYFIYSFNVSLGFATMQHHLEEQNHYYVNEKLNAIFPSPILSSDKSNMLR